MQYAKFLTSFTKPSIVKIRLIAMIEALWIQELSTAVFSRSFG